MFNCRMCTDDIASILGVSNTRRHAASKYVRLQPTNRFKYRRRSKRPQTEKKVFNPRASAEVTDLVKTWESYVHPRAREYFTSHEALVDALTNIAKSINKNEDPILSANDDCVYWYGPVSEGNPVQAVLELEGGADKKPTFVNRLLAYVFATDESFEALMKLPKAPFVMACGDQLCINVKHISAESSN